MKNKLLIFTFLFLFLFSLASPIYAEESSESLSIWERIKIFLNTFITGQKIDIKRTNIATEYSDDPNYPGDITTRIVPEHDRTQKKFKYIIGVINKDYKNQNLEKCPGSDKTVTILDLAHYLVSKNLLNLNEETKNKLKEHPSPSVFNPSCYEKLFEELHIIPPEEQKKDGSETYTLNELSRYIIPAQSQESDLSNVKNIKEDTAKHTEIMYKQIIPKDSQGSNYKELKEQFGSWLRPDSWQN